MVRNRLRPGPVVALGLILTALVLGCASPGSVGEQIALKRLAGRGQRTPEELRASVGWLDVEAQEAGRSTLSTEDLLAFADQARASRKPPVPFSRKSILVVTGGGSYGAYPAGVLVGWTAAGTRPQFDVVTGISTGALLGAFAFLGPSEDGELQRCYTTLRNEDIYRRNRLVRAILSESFADTAPLAKVIAEVATDERIGRFAAEHQKGRRFYVGTTDLDARRAIVWDMGAIASRGTPESRELFRSVLLASASIPGFFPPVRIPITVDGRRYVERHIDGGTTSSMFFAPPWVPPGEREKVPPGWLHAFIMQYQVLPSFMFGFLLTVFPRWMGLPELARWRYVPVCRGQSPTVARSPGCAGWTRRNRKCRPWALSPAQWRPRHESRRRCPSPHRGRVRWPWGDCVSPPS